MRTAHVSIPGRHHTPPVMVAPTANMNHAIASPASGQARMPRVDNNQQVQPGSQVTTPTNLLQSNQVTSSTSSLRYQLVVQPIVKTTIGQRDTSGDTLNDVVVNGSSFHEIIKSLWDQLNSRIMGKAIKTDGVWSVEAPTLNDWTKLMQFKAKGYIVDSSKTEFAWNMWLTAVRGETVKLLIYEYGVAISKAQDLDAFIEACIQPDSVDRAGAAADSSLREVVARL